MAVNLTIDEEVLVSRVHPIVEPVHDALEGGLVMAKRVEQVMGVDRMDRDPFHYAHTTRLHARRTLEEAEPPRGILPEPWQIDRDIANSGIHLLVPGANIRVVRGDLLNVPVAGPSRARQAFYMQRKAVSQSRLPLPDLQPEIDAEAAGLPRNLLLVWTETRSNEVEIAIAVPKGIWTFGQPSRLAAWIPIDAYGGLLDAEFDRGEDDGPVLPMVHIPEERPGSGTT